MKASPDLMPDLNLVGHIWSFFKGESWKKSLVKKVKEMSVKTQNIITEKQQCPLCQEACQLKFKVNTQKKCKPKIAVQ